MKKIYDMMLVLALGLAMMACSKAPEMEPQEGGLQGPETPEVEEVDFYVPVTADKADWSGDYLIAAEHRNGTEIVFAGWKQYGAPARGINLLEYKDEQGRVPAAGLEDYKTVITRNGDKYAVCVANVGYLGVENRHNLTYITEVPVADRFHWTLSYDEEYGEVSIVNYENDGRQLLWNNAPDCFWFGTYASAHDDILPLVVYERVKSLE